jgi:hypothetical protein
MAKYNVLITSPATCSTTVDVEAESPLEAEKKALEEARENPSLFEWTIDDGNTVDPYVCDPGNCAELAEKEDTSADV